MAEPTKKRNVIEQIISLKQEIMEHQQENRTFMNKLQNELNLTRERKTRNREMEEIEKEVLYLKFIERANFRRILEENDPTKRQKKGPFCGICRLEYEKEGNGVPKVLECGHTICQYCALKIAERSPIRHTCQCPFDRKPTELWSRGVCDLPENTKVLRIIDGRPLSALPTLQNPPRSA